MILDAWRNLYNPVTKKLLETVRIMHSRASKVDSSGMPICSCRPRPGAINWSAMPYNSSQGVHPCPPSKTSEDRHIFPVKQESLHPQELNEQFARTSKNQSIPITEKQSMLQTMGIIHTFASKLDSLGMPIGSCRPRPRSIDWSTMPYSLSQGVHPHPT